MGDFLMRRNWLVGCLMFISGECGMTDFILSAISEFPDWISSFYVILGGLPYWLITVIMAAIPVTEARVSVPVAMFVFEMSVWSAMFFSLIGVLIPAVTLPLILERVEAPCRRSWPICDKFFSWLTLHVEKKYTERYRTLGLIGLLLFVTIPLPVTGVWTGSFAAWLFRMPRKKAFLAVLIGAILSILIIAGLYQGVFEIFGWI